MTDSSQIAQVSLQMTWRQMLQQGQNLPSFDQVQFRVRSQNGEDGILLYLFTLLGTTNKRVVEICAGDGQECNSANLILNHGWDGLLLDGNEEKVASGRKFYRQHPDTKYWPPRFEQAWITRDNINGLVSSLGFTGEIDLLSMDLDGNDYWVFDALDVVQPRVVVAEYQQAWGPERAISQRYQEDFEYQAHLKATGGPPFCGASLAALTKAARRKGMRLVGCERRCFNAFFVRDGLAEDLLPEVDPASCFDHPMARYNQERCQQMVPADSDFWVDV